MSRMRPVFTSAGLNGLYGPFGGPKKNCRNKKVTVLPRWP